MSEKIPGKKALLLIDIQHDFCPGGAMAVPEGDKVIAVANHYAARFHASGDPVLATQDWHPAGHGSFASEAGTVPFTTGELNGLQQVWWPDHCIQHSCGAALHKELNQALIDQVFYKGMAADVDSYSAFFDNGHRQHTRTDSWLRSRGITHLVILGLATDYCVKYSVLDALELGYSVEVIKTGCRGVNLHPDDSEIAFAQMVAQGAVVI